MKRCVPTVLQMWSEPDKALTDIQSLHKSPVTLAVWSAAGGRLITADTVSPRHLTHRHTHILPDRHHTGLSRRYSSCGGR